MYKKFVIAILVLLSTVAIAQDEYVDETATEEGATDATLGVTSEEMQGATLIPAEATFKGTFSGRALKIDGRFEGKATADEALEISDIGEVKGNVETSVGTVKGRVEGTVWASEELYLTSTAIVTGEAMCRNLVVEKGALMSTKTSMGEVKVVEGKKTIVPAKGGKARKSTRQRRSRSRSYY